MLEEVFKEYKNIYDKILNKFYPSLGSTGFQERNLTVNFSKAFEKVYSNKNVISWFELQFGENKNNHFDCIIISDNDIYLIESKRYSVPTTKISSVLDDINRIRNFVYNDFDKDERLGEYKDYNIYGIILADVWRENKPKEEVYQKYLDKTFFSELKQDNEIYDVESFENRDDCIIKYALLSYVWKMR